MKPYRFLGTEITMKAAQPSYTNQYGGKIMIADEDLLDAMKSGAQLLPEDRFLAHGFTEKELGGWFSTALFPEAPDDFKVKVAAALEDMHRFRDEVLTSKEDQHAAV